MVCAEGKVHSVGASTSCAGSGRLAVVVVVPAAEELRRRLRDLIEEGLPPVARARSGAPGQQCAVRGGARCVGGALCAGLGFHMMSPQSTRGLDARIERRSACGTHGAHSAPREGAPTVWVVHCVWP